MKSVMFAIRICSSFRKRNLVPDNLWERFLCYRVLPMPAPGELPACIRSHMRYGTPRYTGLVQLRFGHRRGCGPWRTIYRAGPIHNTFRHSPSRRGYRRWKSNGSPQAGFPPERIYVQRDDLISGIRYADGIACAAAHMHLTVNLKRRNPVPQMPIAPRQPRFLRCSGR